MRAIHIIIYIMLIIPACGTHVGMPRAVATPTEADGPEPDGERQRPQWEAIINELTATEDDGEAKQWADFYDLLADMAEHPMNINTATREDFEQLPFLSDRQIEQLCEYLYRYGPMRSTAELQMIEALDYGRRRLLQCLVYAGEPAGKGSPGLREIMKRGKNTLVATAKVPLYERQGDRNGYLGYKYKHWFRYDFESSGRLRFGLTGSQDAGEPFFATGNSMGYDFYSFYLQVRKMGRIENLIVGRYRPAFGKGLVLGSTFSLGKASMTASAGRSTNAIRVHSSRSESDYFQGAAATVRIARGLTVSAFASYRPLDATLNDDGTARTIITSGYHRTLSEMARKNNTHATAAGANVRYAAGGWHAAATAVYTHLDRNLAPLSSTLFRRHYAAGSDFANASADYGYVNHWLSVSGETAIDRHGAMATLNTACITVADELDITLLQRFYSYKYTALHAGSFSDGGAVRNESGIYLGADWHPAPCIRISAYTDYVRFPWARYRISRPSRSSDNMLSVEWAPGRWTLGGRYRLRLRQRDNEQGTALSAYNTHRIRMHAAFDDGRHWSFRTQADFAMTEYKTRDVGWMVSENVNCKLKRLQLNLSAGYFHTDSYESRVYAYERTLLYSLSLPSFYGRGIRTTLMTRADFGRRLMLTARIGLTRYFDRTTIGSGYQAVSSPSMTDIEMQARLRL